MLPLANPNNNAKNAIMGLLEPAGIHKQAVKRRHPKIVMMKVLKRPMRSAQYPGIHRPNMAPKLIKDRRKNEKRDDMPCSSAYEVKYVTGTNRPHSMKNIPMLASIRAGLQNTERSGRIAPTAFGLGEALVE